MSADSKVDASGLLPAAEDGLDSDGVAPNEEVATRGRQSSDPQSSDPESSDPESSDGSSELESEEVTLDDLPAQQHGASAVFPQTLGQPLPRRRGGARARWGRSSGRRASSPRDGEALQPPDTSMASIMMPLFMYGSSIAWALSMVAGHVAGLSPQLQAASWASIAAVAYWWFRPKATAVIALCLAGAYVAWCWTLPVAMPYRVAVYPEVNVHASGTSGHIAGTYELTDLVSAGTPVYRRTLSEGRKSLFLHQHHTPEGRCFWRVSSDMAAPNADMAVHARLAHDCHLHGPDSLRGLREWRAHREAHTWRRNPSVEVVPPRRAERQHMVWPPAHVCAAHTALLLAGFAALRRWRSATPPAAPAEPAAAAAAAAIAPGEALGGEE